MKIINVDNKDYNISKKRMNLTKNDKFNFKCHYSFSCYNQCCRNINLFLYPYDVLRLKNAMNISSDEFVKKNVDIIMRDENSFPDVLLRMKNNAHKTCLFLLKSGCSLYENRPYSCRIFPIEQGVMYSNTDSLYEVNFFSPPNFCVGQHQSSQWTLKQWLKDQDMEIYYNMTIQWSYIRKLFSHNFWSILSDSKKKMIFMAAYDIDNFRNFVFGSSFLIRYEVNKKILFKINYDEVELLKLGFQWIKLLIWGIESPIIKSKTKI